MAIVLQTEHRFLQFLTLNRGRDLYMTRLSFTHHNDVHRKWVSSIASLRPWISITSAKSVPFFPREQAFEEVDVDRLF
jgi:hypothetical protein